MDVTTANGAAQAEEWVAPKGSAAMTDGEVHDPRRGRGPVLGELRGHRHRSLRYAAELAPNPEVQRRLAHGRRLTTAIAQGIHLTDALSVAHSNPAVTIAMASDA